MKAGVSIEDLAESIARHGLIQSLHVRPILDTEGQETGMFEVPAGGRRYRALEMLSKQRRLNKTAPVPCIVSAADSGVLIDEVSLAENIERAPLHPLDQFRAFQATRDNGMTEEAIAAAFFVPGAGREAAPAPHRPLIDAPRRLFGGRLTLEQLMPSRSRTITPARSRSGRRSAMADQRSPIIRRMLTETTVRASDRRAAFVGIDAYQAAGGCACATCSKTMMAAGCRTPPCSMALSPRS